MTVKLENRDEPSSLIEDEVLETDQILSKSSIVDICMLHSKQKHKPNFAPINMNHSIGVSNRKNSLISVADLRHL